MGSWKQYILTLILCAFSCGIISQILSETKAKELIRLVCGIVMAIMILRPLSGTDLESLLEFPFADLTGAESYVAEGERAAFQQQERCISSACETYILDKARNLGAEICVDISLNEDLLPVSAVIRGEIPQEIQMELQEVLTMDLGIPKENQQWIWNPEKNK